MLSLYNEKMIILNSFFLLQILSTESIAKDMDLMIQEINTVVQLPSTKVRMLVRFYQ